MEMNKSSTVSADDASLDSIPLESLTDQLMKALNAELLQKPDIKGQHQQPQQNVGDENPLGIAGLRAEIRDLKVDLVHIRDVIIDSVSEVISHEVEQLKKFIADTLGKSIKSSEGFTSPDTSSDDDNGTSKSESDEKEESKERNQQ